jgi:hypothetical protein
LSGRLRTYHPKPHTAGPPETVFGSADSTSIQYAHSPDLLIHQKRLVIAAASLLTRLIASINSCLAVCSFVAFFGDLSVLSKLCCMLICPSNRDNSYGGSNEAHRQSNNCSWLGDYSCALRADPVGRIAKTTGAQESVCDEQPRCPGKKRGLRCCVKNPKPFLASLGVRKVYADFPVTAKCTHIFVLPTCRLASN